MNDVPQPRLSKSPINCTNCGVTTPVQALQVVPRTADPRDAEALPAEPPSPLFWLCAGILELPGVVAVLVPFADGKSPIGEVTEYLSGGEGRYWQMAVPLFLAIFVLGWTVRAMLPFRWTRAEIAIGLVVATVGLAFTAKPALELTAHVITTPDPWFGGVQRLVVLAFWSTLLAGISFTFVQWYRRIPHFTLLQIILRVSWIPNAAMCLALAAGLGGPGYFNLGWYLTAYTIASYIIVIIQLSLIPGSGQAQIVAQYKPGVVEEE